jgi:hypothetical protein
MIEYWPKRNAAAGFLLSTGKLFSQVVSVRMLTSIDCRLIVAIHDFCHEIEIKWPT